ncbi:MAG: DUF5012 domain-containing protein [Prevotellaceae bacterium]|nr:DUF5012 domain-containing protein [Prevotellaceae bacterium]
MKTFDYTFKCLLTAAVAILALSSCGKETEGVSKTTHYVELELTGGSDFFVSKGGAWNDPGCAALEGETDVSASVKVTGNVNTAATGMYPLTYSAMNKDNFPASVVRRVFVVDVTAPAPLSDGVYTVDKDSYRHVNSSGAEVAYGSNYEITITQVHPGVLRTSDLFGGWYAQRAGYGGAYAMEGYLMYYPDHSVKLLYSHVAGWGDGMDGMTGAYNPADGVLSLSPTYVGNYVFNQFISKKQ